jgi:GNAT superfamily N-acetyltransferase
MMAAVPFTIEPLGPQHDRAAFASGVEPLDRYFATQATQDVRRRVSGCFVAVHNTDAIAVAGFYTIATTSIPLLDLTATAAKKLPRYPLIPAVLIGRLAVAQGHRGIGLGAALLIDGIARTLRADLMAFAVVVDAKDEAAAAFYKHHGFISFVSAPMRFYLPLAEAARQLGISNL